MGKKVAIVGSGCSGLAALWALKPTDHEVHLFEAESTLGGRTSTVSFKGPQGHVVDVDVGPTIINTATDRKSFPCSVFIAHYCIANFIAFLEQVGIEPEKTDITFGFSGDQGKFEWAGISLSTIFAQRSNVFSLRMWRLLFDMIWFNEFAVDVLFRDEESEKGSNYSKQHRKASLRPRESIAEYLDQEGYSRAFRDDYLVPLTAAIWTTSPGKRCEFPANTLIGYLWNRQLLKTLTARPEWKTIPGGSRRYIEAIMENFPNDRLHMKSKVTAVTPSEHNTVMLTSHSQEIEFDHVVLAIHGDQALDVLQSVATKEEIDVLSGFRTSRNIAVLHSDVSLMPKRKVVWSAMNYISLSPFPSSRSSNTKVCLTYWMNMLQHIPESEFGPVLVTLNPLRMPDPRIAQSIWEYTHPLYDAAAIRSQKLLPNIQNTRHISYCGAWTNHGSHEDGFTSGLSAAVNHLGAKLPFEIVDSASSRGRKPVLTWQNYAIRIVILYVHLMMMVLSRLFSVVGRLSLLSVTRKYKLG